MNNSAASGIWSYARLSYSVLISVLVLISWCALFLVPFVL